MPCAIHSAGVGRQQVQVGMPLQEISRGGHPRRRSRGERRRGEWRGGPAFRPHEEVLVRAGQTVKAGVVLAVIETA
jgi:hypothetical protein